MALPSKPTIKNVWATSGLKVEPSDSKVNTGWIVERPPHQFQNFLQNRSDQFLKHINEAGIPVWDAVTTYTAGKSYVQGSDGFIYKCLVDGNNQNPVGNATNWVKTFGDLDVQEYADAAEDSAISADLSAQAAAASQTAAATSATNAANSATAASGSASAASTSATNAATSASTASTKAAEASTSASNALTSQTAAATSATNAATSASSASTSATTATTKAGEASTSATNAAASAADALVSEDNAADSAAAAAASAAAALASQNAAATSATNAGTSETNAAASASAAATSASNAATSETNAETAYQGALDVWQDLQDLLATGPVVSVNGLTGEVTLTKASFNLENVDNTSDLNKPISTATQTALNTKLNKGGDSMTGALNFAPRVTIASASTVDLSTALSNTITVTGTTTVTSFGTLPDGAVRTIVAQDGFTINYNATSMQLPGSRNLTLSAGDTLGLLSLGSGNWKVINYNAYNGVGSVIFDLTNRVNLVTNGNFLSNVRGLASANSAGPVADTWRFGTIGTPAVNAFAPIVSSTPPGFRAWIGLDAYAVNTGTTGAAYLYHPIEGYTFQPAAFGTTQAKPLVLSFWVRAELTGTFFVSLRNGPGSRSYVSPVTVNTANTWEYKEVAIPGDTGGTWNSVTNAAGAYLSFAGFGEASVQAPSLNTWVDGNYISHSSVTGLNLLRISGAGIDIAGVQLEMGYKAGPFIFKTMQETLSSTLRYVRVVGRNLQGVWNSPTVPRFKIGFETVMRAPPSLALTTSSFSVEDWGIANYSTTTGSINISNSEVTGIDFTINGFGSANATQGRQAYMISNIIHVVAELT